MTGDPRKVALVIDNDDAMRRLLSAYLESQGFEVVAVGGNDEALELLTDQKQRIDLVVQDLRRPPGRCLEGEDVTSQPVGLVFYDRFLAGNVQSLPCIFQSGSILDASTAERVRSRPNTCYLSKPYRLKALVAAIRVVLDPDCEAVCPRLEIPAVVVADLGAISDELVAHLARHPEAMYELDPRAFEKLVARLFRDLGYTVELTPRTRDGGLDMRAIRRDDVGPVLYIVECKRYGPQKPVGVQVVRQLYGVKQAERANVAVLATTSSFTRDARDFQTAVGFELSLRDFEDIKRLLAPYR